MDNRVTYLGYGYTRDGVRKDFVLKLGDTVYNYGNSDVLGKIVYFSLKSGTVAVEIPGLGVLKLHKLGTVTNIPNLRRFGFESMA